ncbi:MAG TPA: 1-acyl-sn-glycerol-3-phosphate acyltransferase, partial [Myxococcales bacterium]|nr:1-acyl-sn-glycerol-3-phosphate acyltransferase [Myxococcales bacterium]
KALPENATAVFLINHRSNFDYVVVGWALARQVAISYAVGEWARVFPLDWLFKAFGGFFVRRGFPDPLYHSVLRRYLQLITRRGVTQGIFPEGGLTRDGALRSPKVGLLDALLQLSSEPGFDRELYFVPVGINYDRVLEDNALLKEARGKAARPPTAAEKLRGALKLIGIVPWRVLVNLLRVATGRLHRAGYVAVAFGEPVKLRDLPQAQRLATASDEERRGIAKEVAVLLMDRIAHVVPATPVPLVARAALELGATDKNALIVKVRELKARLDELGVPVAEGKEFDTQRTAREDLAETDRNRDLLRLEGDLLDSEEAEQIVRLGLKRLVQRKALRRDGDKVFAGSHPELLDYYARSLACLSPTAASRATSP